MKTATNYFGIVLALALSMLFAVTIVSAQVGVEAGGSSETETSASGADASMSIEGEAVVCTMDAYQCSDGSWIGRSGPNCEFVCPVDGGNGGDSTEPANSDTSMPVEPDGGIGDGALPLKEVLVAEVMTETGVSAEVATEIVEARAGNQAIVAISVGDGDNADEDEVSIAYEADSKILGIFNYPVRAVASVSADGSVKTSYPGTPWYIWIVLFNTQKSALEETAINISAAISGSVNSQ